MTAARFFVLFNPGSGRGLGRRRMGAWRDLLTRHLEIDAVETRDRDDIGHQADRALAAGYRNIVAVGGDGTWSLVADRLLNSQYADVRLGVLPAGTGNDFGKSLGVTWPARERVIRSMAEGRVRRVDVGRVEGRYFLNVFGCGFDIACIDDASRFRRLRGELLYKYCAIRQLFRYRSEPMRIVADEQDEGVTERLLVVISNARYFGGSFDIAPWADLSDNRLDLVAVRDCGALERARLFQIVARGRHRDGGAVMIRSARRFRLEYDAPLRYELDGEVYATNADHLEIESMPQALNVFCPGPEARH